MMDLESQLPRRDEILLPVVDEHGVRRLHLGDAERPLEDQRRRFADAEPARAEESLEDRAQPEALDAIHIERFGLVVQGIKSDLAGGSRSSSERDRPIKG